MSSKLLIKKPVSSEYLFSVFPSLTLNGFTTFIQFLIVDFAQLFATGKFFIQFRLASSYLSFENKPPIHLLKILILQIERHLLHPIPFDLFLDSSEVSSYHLESRTKLLINKRQATGSIKLISSLIVSQSSYIFIQSSFISFSSKIFRLTDLDMKLF